MKILILFLSLSIVPLVSTEDCAADVMRKYNECTKPLKKKYEGLIDDESVWNDINKITDLVKDMNGLDCNFESACSEVRYEQQDFVLVRDMLDEEYKKTCFLMPANNVCLDRIGRIRVQTALELSSIFGRKHQTSEKMEATTTTARLPKEYEMKTATQTKEENSTNASDQTSTLSPVTNTGIQHKATVTSQDSDTKTTMNFQFSSDFSTVSIKDASSTGKIGNNTKTVNSELTSTSRVNFDKETTSQFYATGTSQVAKLEFEDSTNSPNATDKPPMRERTTTRELHKHGRMDISLLLNNTNSNSFVFSFLAAILALMILY